MISAAAADPSGYASEAYGSELLTIDGLTVSYQTNRGAVRAVNDVSLKLRRGEICGIAGESGSGKSTLLNTVCRLLKYPGEVETGSIRFYERDGASLDILGLEGEELRRFRWARISMVFQSALNALNPVLDIEAQLDDVLKAHRPELTAEMRRARAIEVLRLVGVPPQRLSAYPHQLSGGTRQRVMIAMALVLQPDIVLMDEPTTALDVVTQRQILQELLTLRDTLGFSVVFITHDLSLLLEIADRVSVMYAGRLVEQSTPRELLERPAHPYSAGLINSFPPLTGPRRELIGIPGDPPDLSELPQGCSFAPRCAYAYEACLPGPPPLLERPNGGRVACVLNRGHGLTADDQGSAVEEDEDE
jgi:peptide/nickel transport system ATP-binding protein